MSDKDILINNTLQSRKRAIEHELKELVQINEYNSLSRAIVSRQRSNRALQRFLDSGQKDKKAYDWADIWNKSHKKMMDIEKKKDIIGYGSKRAKLKIELFNINTELYFRNKGKI